MSWPASPDWLLELQRQFGDLLRTPLERTGGALRAATEAYDARLVSGTVATPSLTSAERLAIYHRQYWFRLFTVLQGLYPLTARLVGYWRFNELAERHLLEHPPRGFDLDVVGDGFPASLEQQLREVDSIVTATGQSVDAAGVLEAARIDAGFHRVARAPVSEPLRPGPSDIARFSSSCLVLSPSVALLKEHFALCELRASLLEGPGDRPLPLGERLPAPRHWLLARHATQLGLLALEPLEAELLHLLQAHPLPRALGLLEASASEPERAQLPGQAQAWLARSVRLGVWAGFVST